MNPQENQPWQPQPTNQPQPAPPQAPQPAQPGYAQQQPPQAPSQWPQPTQPQQPTYQQAPPQDYSIDYLDQIAAPVQQSRKPHKLMLLIFILLGALVLVGIAALLLAARPSTLDRASELSARMETLAKISKDQHKNLRDNGLRANNTAYTIFLTNAISDLKAPLEAAGIEKKETQALANKEKEYAETLTKSFEDARLNVVLDRTYAREMAYQLDVIQSMMRSIYNANSSTQLRGYLDSANGNLAPIAKTFSDFATAE